jgi:hypothetical protein
MAKLIAIIAKFVRHRRSAPLRSAMLLREQQRLRQDAEPAYGKVS